MVVEVKRAVRIDWADRQGHWHMRHFGDVRELASFCDRLRCEATIKDAAGHVIGGVERLFDGGRRKWAWYFDPDERVEKETKEKTNERQQG
jgi:hypothetical protein